MKRVEDLKEVDGWYIISIYEMASFLADMLFRYCR
jgi:hypothetical protein